MSTPFNFKYDPNEASSGFELIEKGEYEAFISDAEVVTFQSSGNPGIKLTFTIRDDIPGQKFGKRKLWQNLSTSPKAMFMFHTIAKAVGLPEGWNAESLEQYRDAVQSKPIRLMIGQRHEPNQQGVQELRNNIMAFKLSEASGSFVAPPLASDPFQGGTPLNISDDDLPF